MEEKENHEPLLDKSQPNQSQTTSESEFRNEKISQGKRNKYLSAKEKYFSKRRVLIGESLFSTLFFGWIGPLLAFGSRFYVKQQAIPYLHETMYPEYDYNILYNKFQNTKKSNVEGMTLVKSMAASFKKILILILILVAFLVLLSMYTPTLTQKIMEYIEEATGRDLGRGIGLFMAVFVLTFCRTVGETHLYYQFAMLGYNLSNTLSLLIYAKALRYPVLCDKQYSISEIINYSQTDSQRLTSFGYYMATLLFTPIQIIIGIYLLYSFIGLAFLSGIGIMALVMGVVFVVSKIASKANDVLLKAKDARMKATEELFNIIRFIKINAMEKYFFRKLNSKRNDELKLIKKVNTMWVVTILMFWLAVPLILSMTFATFTWMGNLITPTQAFTTIILMRILQFPLRMFPTSIAWIVQIWASMKRVQKFLLADQIDSRCLKNGQPSDSGVVYIDSELNEFAITILNGTFQWGLQINKQKEEQKNLKQGKKQQKVPTKQPGKQETDQQSQRQIVSELYMVEDQYKQSMLSEASEISSPSLKQKQIKDQPKYIVALKQINVRFTTGKFTMILGDIGSGKSSLLYSILNEMKPGCANTEIYINGSIAYVAQKAWIMSSTVKENITFTLAYDEQRFNRAVKHASLQQDLKIMTDGVQTQIGEKGVNLSGGQKARISLARALYCDRDIYLLDDVISAVDVHVGRFLMKETILGYLKGKTVLMATHAISFAEYADEIVLMKKGRITKKGTYQEISKSEQFKELTEIQQKRKEQEKQRKADREAQATVLQLERISKSKSKEDERKMQEKQLQIRQSQLIDDENQEEKEKQIQKTKTDKLVTELMLPEDQRKGKVQWKVYKAFIDINGGLIFVFGVLSCMCGWLVLSTLSNVEMQLWCDDPEGSHYKLYLYLGFSISSSVFMFVRAYILVMSGIRQGTIVHKKMIKALLYASIPNFYNRIPIGRIINRLTKDLRQLDQSVGYSIGGLLVDTFSLLGNLIICTYASSPWVLIPMVGVGLICFKIKNYYMRTQRQIVRLENVTTSPIVTGFMSTINGLATIRAYNLQQEFLQTQFQKINKNKRMRLARQALQSWFSLRLTLLSFLINMSAIAYCIFSQSSSSSIAGLLLTYALTLNSDIIGVMFSLAYVEGRMVSVERVLNFMDIQAQPGYIQYCKKWRTKQEGFDQSAIQMGKIQFDNFSVRYREGLPLVLKKINLKIQAGQKVGIVGRTGAGKSTIASCLLRILDASYGGILIDGKNITEYTLKDLRSCITMIEQQPTLINASIKQNLDPSFQYSTEELQKIIQECNLTEMITARGGLQSEISNDALSVGEKQLLCICRALLKNSKIVLIDEATANIDVRNDQLIQQIIAKKFTQSTVLTIAHRLSTLRNSDKILVLGDGKVIQWGSPDQLLSKPQGIYRQMTETHDQDYLK